LRQKIITEIKVDEFLPRLGILDENAYYKNSGLYIEVGRISPSLEKKLGLRE
jgi:hypothetical protein